MNTIMGASARFWLTKCFGMQSCHARLELGGFAVGASLDPAECADVGVAVGPSHGDEVGPDVRPAEGTGFGRIVSRSHSVVRLLALVCVTLACARECVLVWLSVGMSGRSLRDIGLEIKRITEAEARTDRQHRDLPRLMLRSIKVTSNKGHNR